jgi:hypothetical protein
MKAKVHLGPIVKEFRQSNHMVWAGGPIMVIDLKAVVFVNPSFR